MKNKFVKSTIILIIGGLITKILGMAIKIVLTRTIGTEGISKYMLVLPTFNLFITLRPVSHRHIPLSVSSGTGSFHSLRNSEDNTQGIQRSIYRCPQIPPRYEFPLPR